MHVRVCDNECVCVLKGESERGSLVCRPLIYGAVTLTEESSFSQQPGTDKRSRFDAVLSLILTSLSVPLIFRFYSNPLDLHHPHSSAHSRPFIPFMSHSSSSSETRQRLKTGPNRKPRPRCVCSSEGQPSVSLFSFRATEKLESIPACTGQGLCETFNLIEKTDKPK